MSWQNTAWSTTPTIPNPVPSYGAGPIPVATAYTAPPPTQIAPTTSYPYQTAGYSTEQQIADWKQWQEYTQQYAAWHAQYGEQYTREMQLLGNTAGAVPPMVLVVPQAQPPQPPLPPPPEDKPPPPPPPPAETNKPPPPPPSAAATTNAPSSYFGFQGFTIPVDAPPPPPPQTAQETKSVAPPQQQQYPNQRAPADAHYYQQQIQQQPHNPQQHPQHPQQHQNLQQQFSKQHHQHLQPPPQKHQYQQQPPQQLQNLSQIQTQQPPLQRFQLPQHQQQQKTQQPPPLQPLQLHPQESRGDMRNVSSHNENEDFNDHPRQGSGGMGSRNFNTQPPPRAQKRPLLNQSHQRNNMRRPAAMQFDGQSPNQYDQRNNQNRPRSIPFDEQSPNQYDQRHNQMRSGSRQYDDQSPSQYDQRQYQNRPGSASFDEQSPNQYDQHHSQMRYDDEQSSDQYDHWHNQNRSETMHFDDQSPNPYDQRRNQNRSGSMHFEDQSPNQYDQRRNHNRSGSIHFDERSPNQYDQRQNHMRPRSRQFEDQSSNQYNQRSNSNAKQHANRHAGSINKSAPGQHKQFDQRQNDSNSPHHSDHYDHPNIQRQDQYDHQQEQSSRQENQTVTPPNTVSHSSPNQPAPSTAVTPDVDPEKLFDDHLRKWDKEFEMWKQQNANHPDRKQYEEYEHNFGQMRQRLLERREMMRRKRGIPTDYEKETATAPIAPPPSLPEVIITTVNILEKEIVPSTNIVKPQDNANVDPLPQVVKTVSIVKPQDNVNKDRLPPTFNTNIVKPQEKCTPAQLMPSDLKTNDTRDHDVISQKSKIPSLMSIKVKTPTSDCEIVELDSSAEYPSLFGKSAIPGLDLVGENDSLLPHLEPSSTFKKDLSKRKDKPSRFSDNVKKKDSVDYEAISKGIDSLLSDPNLLSLLSSVNSGPKVQPNPADVVDKSSDVVERDVPSVSMVPAQITRPADGNSNLVGLQHRMGQMYDDKHPNQNNPNFNHPNPHVNPNSGGLQQRMGQTFENKPLNQNNPNFNQLNPLVNPNSGGIHQRMGLTFENKHPNQNNPNFNKLNSPVNPNSGGLQQRMGQTFDNKHPNKNNPNFNQLNPPVNPNSGGLQQRMGQTFENKPLNQNNPNFNQFDQRMESGRNLNTFKSELNMSNMPVSSKSIGHNPFRPDQSAGGGNNNMVCGNNANSFTNAKIDSFADNNFYQTAKVIDYQNRTSVPFNEHSQNPNTAIGYQNRLQPPVKIFDYGNQSKPSANLMNIQNQKTTPPPVKFFDYQNQSKPPIITDYQNQSKPPVVFDYQNKSAPPSILQKDPGTAMRVVDYGHKSTISVAATAPANEFRKVKSIDYGHCSAAVTIGHHKVIPNTENKPQKMKRKKMSAVRKAIRGRLRRINRKKCVPARKKSAAKRERTKQLNRNRTIKRKGRKLTHDIRKLRRMRKIIKQKPIECAVYPSKWVSVVPVEKTPANIRTKRGPRWLDKKKLADKKLKGMLEAISSDDDDIDLEPEPPSPPSLKTAMDGVPSIDDLLMPPGRANRPQKIVIILRGPPGSGKSYVAKLIKNKEIELGGIAPRVMTIDDYFLVDVDTSEIFSTKTRYEFDATYEDNYMQCLLKTYKKTIATGYYEFVIVDCVNSSLREYTDFYNTAKEFGFVPYTIDMHHDVELCARRNIHGRTKEQIQAIVNNWKTTPSHYVKLSVDDLLADAQSKISKALEVEEISNDEDEGDEMIDDDEDDNFEDFESLTMVLDELPANEDDGSDANCEDKKDDDEDEADTVQPEFGIKSRWDSDTSEQHLAKLDGISKPMHRQSKTMEEYLQMDGWEQPPQSADNKKRVRWADIEEKRAQEKMRAIGFVVGQTDWNRMMDPTEGDAALTNIKYI